ncbi:MAG: branched-chain amino acid ABC transporter permease [Deltaproteobacteria bacterium]|jgi:branched-chain amino acid transport system permease protein|nr:branched-chain amino acid ABC transporter permease [Deltaproteobacteria bacterium]MBT4644729.1 branched-chain amino acid ABC transporter permease [Deltaproteobacteria bacterium]MBT6504690.1 branched-chain amino acid ABC transporter permease [Deltaproteobacteria bacterium]MBT6614604.1 branched-chain amino acid ABC transporter permease [Deltaproteobacteria bacterium]MBT7153890.1 branched-chain amino acid ABC transporter permease [Deltaproteobacteria bacterium]
MDQLISVVVIGLSVGGMYALLALGLAMVFAVIGLVNFAHGEMIAVTGYSMFFLLMTGIPFSVVAIFAVFMAIIAAVLMERIAFRPVRNATLAAGLITSFALEMILETGWSNFISPLRRPIKIPPWVMHYWQIGDTGINTYQIIAILMTIISVVTLTIFLKRTILGLAMRAAAEDFPVVQLMGIRANRVIATAFAISGMLAGFAGLLWIAQRSSVDPHIGLNPTIKAFIAVVFGGVGSLSGAVAGGLILGIMEVCLRSFLPESAMPFREAIGYSVVILVLLKWPDGLISMKFGRKKD